MARLLPPAWLPLPLLGSAIAVAWLLNPSGSYVAVPLTVALQLVFLTATSVAVIALVGRAFVASGALGLSLLASAAVCLGSGGVMANLVGRGEPNLTVTVHNLCIWCSAAFHLAGIALTRQRLDEHARAASLIAAIAAGAAAVALSTAAALYAWVPPFFVQGEGGTPTRQVVLGSAIAMFALAGSALMRGSLRLEAPAYRRWYALGLLLTSLGLTGVLIQRSVGGIVGWVGVAAQLLAGAYLFVAAWLASRTYAGRLELALASPPSGALMRYGLALVFVLVATALRLALFSSLGVSEPYILFLPAVVLAAFFGGLGPGLIASVAAVGSADLWWIEPIGASKLSAAGNWLPASLFLANCALIVVLVESMRRAQRRSSLAEAANAANAERERGAVALAAGQERLHMALDAARMVAWEYDPVADRILASDNYSEVYGLVPGIPLQRAADGFALVHPEDVDRHRATVNDAIRRGTAYASSFRITRPSDGQLVWIEERGRAIVSADGRTDRLVGTANDVTERKLAEDRVRASEARFRTLFDTMDEGFCIVELIFDDVGRPLDYRFLEVNPAFEKHTGLRDIVGQTALEAIPDLGQFWIDLYGQVAVTGKPRRFVQSARAMGGRSFDVYAFRLGNGGRVAGWRSS